MVNIIVLKPFYDLKRHVTREEGDVFKVTEKRAEQLDLALPGYIVIEAEQKPDLTKLSYQELASLAKERGLKYRGRPTKAQLIDALTKE